MVDMEGYKHLEREVEKSKAARTPEDKIIQSKSSLERSLKDYSNNKTIYANYEEKFSWGKKLFIKDFYADEILKILKGIQGEITQTLQIKDRINMSENLEDTLNSYFKTLEQVQRVVEKKKVSDIIDSFQILIGIFSQTNYQVHIVRNRNK